MNLIQYFWFFAESAGEDEDQLARGSGSPGGGSADEGSAEPSASREPAQQSAYLRMAGNRRPRGFLAGAARLPPPPHPHVNFDPEAPPTPTATAANTTTAMQPPSQQMSLLEKPEIDKKVKVSRLFRPRSSGGLVLSRKLPPLNTF